MLFGKILTVYCKNHVQPVNTVFTHSAVLDVLPFLERKEGRLWEITMRCVCVDHFHVFEIMPLFTKCV